MAERAQRLALKRYTCAGLVAETLNVHVPAYRAGEVGIVKAFPYSEGCIPAKVRRGLSLSLSLSASLVTPRRTTRHLPEWPRILPTSR
jgi:hypothetical protein